MEAPSLRPGARVDRNPPFQRSPFEAPAGIFFFLVHNSSLLYGIRTRRYEKTRLEILPMAYPKITWSLLSLLRSVPAPGISSYPSSDWSPQVLGELRERCPWRCRLLRLALRQWRARLRARGAGEPVRVPGPEGQGEAGGERHLEHGGGVCGQRGAVLHRRRRRLGLADVRHLQPDRGGARARTKLRPAGTNRRGGSTYDRLRLSVLKKCFFLCIK
eukprot:1187364-Prorocentrum_minimum.AAC.3